MTFEETHYLESLNLDEYDLIGLILIEVRGDTWLISWGNIPIKDKESYLVERGLSMPISYTCGGLTKTGQQVVDSISLLSKVLLLADVEIIIPDLIGQLPTSALVECIVHKYAPLRALARERFQKDVV